MAERHSAVEGLAVVRPGAVALRELPFAAQMNVRTSNPEALGLPRAPNATAPFGGSTALWLGPDEWLVVGPDGDEKSIEQALLRAGGDVSVVDLSANRTILELTGPRAREVLMQGCSLDLHPRAFGPGRCAQTMLARAQVILEGTGDDAYRIFVRRSFAAYLADWLLDAIAIASESVSEREARPGRSSRGCQATHVGEADSGVIGEPTGGDWRRGSSVSGRADF